MSSTLVSAANSSTTSPFRRTAASRSSGVRPCVRIATSRRLECEQRQRADRLDLQRGADAQQQVRDGAQLAGALQRSLGEQLAEQHDFGLQRTAAAFAAGDAVGIAQTASAHLQLAGWRRRSRAGAARDASRAPRSARVVPALRWSMSTFWVITPSSMPLRSIATSALMGAVGLLVAERGEALAVEAPEAHRVGAEGVDVRDLHRVDVLPQRRCRACGSRGSPTAPRCRRRSARRPSARRARARPGARSPRPAVLAACAAIASAPPDPSFSHRPYRSDPRRAHRGARPPRLVSRKSRRAFAEEGGDALARVLAQEHGGETCFSASMPSSRSPAPETRLICSIASGACAGELARPVQRGVEQFVVLDHAVDEPELERLVGEDRVADEVHLERLVRRRRGAAGAGCRRSRG